MDQFAVAALRQVDAVASVGSCNSISTTSRSFYNDCIPKSQSRYLAYSCWMLSMVSRDREVILWCLA